MSTTTGNAKSLIKEIESKYRDNPLHGIQFSIDKDCYDSNIESTRVRFGEPTMDTNDSFQEMFIDDILYGYVHEHIEMNYLHPTVTSFEIIIADCTEEEKLTVEDLNNPHFKDCGEAYILSFATLQQVIDYLGIK